MLDKDTKRQFNDHFMHTLEQAMRGQSLSQFIHHQTGINQLDAAKAMNDIFPPNYYNYGSNVVDAMNKKDVSSEVENLVKKFTKGSTYDLKAQEARLQRELALAKMDIDEINKEVEAKMANQAQLSRAQSNHIKNRGKLSELPVPVEQDFEESMVEIDDTEPSQIDNSPSPINIKMAQLAYAPQNEQERL